MNIHSLLHALGLDLGSNHGIRRPATVPSNTQHVPIPSSLSDERIAAIEGARRRMPVSLTPTSPRASAGSTPTGVGSPGSCRTWTKPRVTCPDGTAKGIIPPSILP